MAVVPITVNRKKAIKKVVFLLYLKALLLSIPYLIGYLYLGNFISLLGILIIFVFYQQMIHIGKKSFVDLTILFYRRDLTTFCLVYDDAVATRFEKLVFQQLCKQMKTKFKEELRTNPYVLINKFLKAVPTTCKFHSYMPEIYFKFDKEEYINYLKTFN